MIAAFGDLHVGRVGRRQPKTGRIKIGDEAGLWSDEIFRRGFFMA